MLEFLTFFVTTSSAGVNGVMKILTKKVVKQGKNYLQIDKSKLNFEVEQ